MKKLEIMVQPDKLEVVRRILEEASITEYDMIDVMKNNTQTGIVKKYRGAQYPVTQIKRIKVELVVADTVADTLINKVKKGLSMGNTMEGQADNKIFVYDVQEMINI